MQKFNAWCFIDECRKKRGGCIKILSSEHSGLEQGEREDALQESFFKHYPDLVRRMTVILGNRHDAEDIAQEAFLKLYRSEQTIYNIGAWLKKVGFNLAMNLIRGEKNRKVREEFYTSQEVGESSEQIVMKKLEIDLVKRVLRELAERDRRCLVLRMSGFSYAEIGRIMDIPVKSVGTLVSRANKRFKDRYDFLQGGGQNCLVMERDMPAQRKNVPGLMEASCRHTLTASYPQMMPRK